MDAVTTAGEQPATSFKVSAFPESLLTAWLKFQTELQKEYAYQVCMARICGFVPGHGEVQNKQFLAKRTSDAENERLRIKALIAQGKTLEQVQDAVGDPPASQKNTPGSKGPRFVTFAAIAYRELSGQAK